MAGSQTFTIDRRIEAAELVEAAVASDAFPSAGDMIAAALHRWGDERDYNLLGYSMDELRALGD